MMSKQHSITEPYQTAKGKWLATIITGTVILAGVPALSALELLQLQVFCRPAAVLSALFLGVPCLTHPEGYMLASEILPTCVTTECSASTFFILLTGLMAGLFYGDRRNFSLRHLMALIAGCYATTIIANVTRIVLGWQAGTWAQAALPHKYRGALHLSVGVLTFVTVLLLTYAIAWRLNNERYCKENSPAA